PGLAGTADVPPSARARSRRQSSFECAGFVSPIPVTSCFHFPVPRLRAAIFFKRENRPESAEREARGSPSLIAAMNLCGRYCRFDRSERFPDAIDVFRVGRNQPGVAWLQMDGLPFQG